MINFNPLYTTARVVTAIYRVASTTLLLLYLGKRIKDGRKFRRHGSRQQAIDEVIRN